MFEVIDINGNKYTAYGIRCVDESLPVMGRVFVGDREVFGCTEEVFRTELFIYNQYAGEWQWSDAEDYKPVAVSGG
jgi:hypothetical protein